MVRSARPIPAQFTLIRSGAASAACSDGRGHLGGVSDVGLNEPGAAAELVGQGPAPVAVPVDDGDRRSGPAQAAGRGLAESGAAPADQRALLP